MPTLANHCTFSPVKFPEVLRQMPTVPSPVHHLCAFLQPPTFLQQQQHGQKCPGLGKTENARAGMENKVQARSGLMLKTFSKIKQILSVGHCSCTKIVSSVLIIHAILQYNIDIYYTEYYVHYAGYIFSMFLEDAVCVCILHSVECNTLVYDK